MDHNSQNENQEDLDLPHLDDDELEFLRRCPFHRGFVPDPLNSSEHELLHRLRQNDPQTWTNCTIVASFRKQHDSG